ncbi:zinc-ribbon domain-containing protein [Brumimicrobium oceani]|uniref:Zinc-ribbon domain-containing protein n=1 Tax=Brumimicrobium oceani TaxID=2100725 RepID=A0A2U2XEY2_9FLAO|nr:zinc-ribbon domain-containing protein [Brumimicrobium oceani]PWH86359.1 hypothetical protein DIT68_03720 [Brumimicrobium oceani]
MYCSNCGNEIFKEANFCSNCGIKLGPSINSKEVNSANNFETFSFSSNFILGGSLLTPDRVTITSSELIYRKRNSNFIGVDEIAIPFKRISSFELDRRLISTMIVVYTMGNEIVKLKSFSIGDAKKIRKVLNERLV